MKDLRTLCDEAIQLWDADCDMEGVINEMRVHLAQPEPEGPTDEELWEIWDEVDGSIPTIFRAVLARWGRSTSEEDFDD